MGTSNWKNLRIAILTPTFFEYSGIDRLVETSLEGLKKNGNTLSIFTLSATIRTKNANVFVLGMPKSQFLSRIYRLLFFLDLPKIIKYTPLLKDYDIVISHFYPMNILASLAKKRYNVLYIYHNAGVAYPLLFKRFSERLYISLFNLLNNLTIKNADEVISISKFLRDMLKTQTGIKSSVEYPIIDKKRFNRQVNGEKIRLEYNLKKNKVVLYVGRISPHKGLHILINSFKIAKNRINNLKLLIVGKTTFSDYFTELKKLSKDVQNDVIFTGFIEDNLLPQFYGCADIYATASLWEGYNLPLIEAQACGKLVVAFNICSHPEVVKNGILVKVGDTDAFADAILNLLNYSEKRK